MSERDPGKYVVTINARHDGQRVDNYLFNLLKSVPKSRVYKAIRRGEVRINKGRCKASSRIYEGDMVRVPPLRQAAERPILQPSKSLKIAIESSLIINDNHLIILNKPTHIPVHGGTGVTHGVIEVLRNLFDDHDTSGGEGVELAHRIDRDTSGCLIVVKNINILKEIQGLFKSNSVSKKYLTIVKGHWPISQTSVNLPLKKNQLSSGERIVRVDEAGKSAITKVKVMHHYQSATLLEVTILTGRTHQIRVHCAAKGHPVIGDNKYGDKQFNTQIAKTLGTKRMLLHAATIGFAIPSINQSYAVSACLDSDFKEALEALA